MSTMKIALDAGHGYNTSGRRCMAAFDPAQTREWTLNDRIMDKLEKELKDYDCEILRVDDTTGAKDVSLTSRVISANSWHADLYLSMHHNAGIGGKTGGGVVVYHDCTSTRGIELASLLYQHIVTANHLAGNRSRKVISKEYYVLHNTKMRAYLVENGFMDSSIDTPIIVTEEHANNTVKGILNWLVEDVGLIKKTTAVVEPEKPKDVNTDPADLAAGISVVVKGTIYATGLGKGSSILKNSERMYITGYAGSKYPYCWGVSKNQGGKRQGWARAEDLTIIPQADESLVDGSSIDYFPACSNYKGSSISAGLKSIGAKSSYAYRKEIAEENNIEGYKGTAAQNSLMLRLLKDGKLIKP